MCNAGAAAGAQMGAGMTSAYQQYQQGKQNESYYNYLGDQANKQAGEVDVATAENLSNINADAGKQQKQVRENSTQTQSSQRAAMAANGVYSDSGTFDNVIGDTQDKQRLDEAAIKFNADQASYQTKKASINQKLELYGQATTAKIQGSNARLAGNIAAASTLVAAATGAGAKLQPGASAAESQGYKENYSGKGARRPS